MMPMKPRVPEGARVYSFLYRTADPEYLTQDVLAVSLPNGFYIDVGWFPEHDPGGSYVIRVFYQYWDAQQILPIQVKTVDEVIQVVESLANRISSGAVATSVVESPGNRISSGAVATSLTSCSLVAECMVTVPEPKSEPVGPEVAR